MNMQQLQTESEAVLAYIRARPTLHDEMMGYAQVAKNAPTAKMRDLAQSRFYDVYNYALGQLGIKE